MIEKITTREEARRLTVTHPYPDTRNGLKKTKEEVWINGLNGQPTEKDARYQMEKCIGEFKSQDFWGFYCQGGIHSGVFCEVDYDRGYGPEHKTWKYYIHYAVYR